MKSGFPHIPAFRLAVLLISGIVLQLHTSIPGSLIWISFFICSAVYILLFTLSSGKLSYRIVRIQGAVLIITCITIGALLAEIHDPLQKENYFGNYLESAKTVQCRVIEPVEVKEKTIKLLVEAEAVYTDETINGTQGKAIVYLQKNGLQKMPEYGSILVIKNKFTQPVASQNPGAFDYKKYLQTQGIYYTAYVKTDEYTIADITITNPLWTTIFNCRAYFSKQLTDYIHNTEVQGVALALILGNRSLLDPETRDHFAKTGTMHVLAVSGLHVGIFYAILELLLSALPFFKKNDRSIRRYIKPTIIVLCIWFYAGITGFPPSIFRAAVMFTMLAFGRLDGRQINSYNILAASAIILIFIDPFMIQEVGFQLSFLAVFGIVAFQPYLYKLWKIKNPVGKYFWSLATVSIAAQLGTAAITIYYFHQFPNYFLLTNMVAIPLAFVVLVSGLLLFTVSWIPAIGVIAGWIVYVPVYVMVKCMWLADLLPGATTEYLQWNLLQTLLLLAIFLTALLILTTKNKDYLYATFLCFILFVAAGVQNKISIRQNSEISFLQVTDNPVISIFDGETLFVLTENPIAESSPQFTYTLKPLMQHYGSKSAEQYCMDSILQFPVLHNDGKLIVAGNTYLYILNSNTLPEITITEPVYLFICNNPYLEMENVKNKFPNAVWIADNTNAYNSTNYWAKYCKENGIRFHDLRKQSALRIALNS